MSHAGTLEPIGERDELAFTLNGEDDGVRVGRQVARRAFSGRVNEMRGQDAKRQIPADDAVVVVGFRGAFVPAAGGPGVSLGADVERS